MAETMRHHGEDREGFYIHEDIASTADTEYPDEHDAENDEDEDQMEGGYDHESQEADSSDGDTVDGDIQNDMDKLQDAFPGFRDKFRLIKRIGEGWSPPPPTPKKTCCLATPNANLGSDQAPFPPSTRPRTSNTTATTTRGTWTRTATSGPPRHSRRALPASPPRPPTTAAADPNTSPSKRFT